MCCRHSAVSRNVSVCFWALTHKHWVFVQLFSSRFLCVWHWNEQRAKVWFMVVHICIHATQSFLPLSLPPTVDIREIRELRLGKGSRDFERYPEEARKLDSTHCFIVLYGLEFRLRTLSVAGQCVCVYKLLSVYVYWWFPKCFHSYCLVFLTVMSAAQLELASHHITYFLLLIFTTLFILNNQFSTAVYLITVKMPHFDTI